MGVALTTYKSWEPILQVIPHLPPFVSLTPSVFDAFKAPGASCRGRCFEEFHEYEIPFLLIRGTLRIPREDWGTSGKIRGITTPHLFPTNMEVANSPFGD